MHRRDGQVTVVGEDRSHPIDVFDFLPKVQFAVKRGGKMLKHRLHIHHLIEGGTRPDLLRKYFQQGKILLNVAPRGRTLDLHNHTVSVFKGRSVDLRDGPGSKRFRIDRLEHVLPRHPNSCSATRTTSDSGIGGT